MNEAVNHLRNRDRAIRIFDAASKITLIAGISIAGAALMEAPNVPLNSGHAVKTLLAAGTIFLAGKMFEEYHPAPGEINES